MRAGAITTAAVIAVLTAAWLASGLLAGDDGVAEHPSLADAAAAPPPATAPTPVRATVMRAVPLPQRVQVRGRTQNKRTVDVRAETGGRVVERPVERGDPVAQGDLLCRLHMADRHAQLRQAEAAVEQARLEHEGSLRLQQRALQSETAIAQAKARLAAAEAQREAASLDIERTRVLAPFAGVVEDVMLEVGDFVQPGAPCTRVVDLDPMLLVGRVSETEVHRFEVGAAASGRLATGAPIAGPVSFIGRQADPGTRTYRVEVTLPNPDYALRSGLTAQFEVTFGETLVHKVSPALLVLDDAGRVGLRIVEAGDTVAYAHVDIVDDGDDGVWVAGLPRRATVITVGHQFVVAGDRVRVDLEPDAQGPANAPESAPEPQDAASRDQPLAAAAPAARPDARIADGT